MIWYLQPNQEPDAAPMKRQIPSPKERFNAGFEKRRLEADHADRADYYRGQLAHQIMDAISEHDPDFQEPRISMKPWASEEDPDLALINGGRLERAFSYMQAAREQDPDLFPDLPTTMEEFDGIWSKRRDEDYLEVSEILDAAPQGSWGPELAGSLGSDVTDPINMATMLLGAPSGIGVLRTIAVEAAIGAGTEAAQVEFREKQVAKELGIEEPSTLDAALFGGALGGLLGGAGAGAARYLEYRAARQAGTLANAPEGIDQIEGAFAVKEAEEALRTGKPLDAVMPPAMANAGSVEDLAARIIGIESGGKSNAKNPNSSAAGLGQFIDSTWLQMMEKYRPDLFEGRSRADILAMKYDPAISREMTANYVKDNQAFLAERGLPTGPGEAYLAHFAGPQGAANILSAPLNTPISRVMTRKQIAANRSIRFKGKAFSKFTVGDLRNWANYKMRSSNPIVASDVPDLGPTSRGYTGSGQVRASDDITIDVEYQVVDASLLKRASGDLQPRDRSRGTSDAWIKDTAARLDPVLLMPSSTADRGTPIVGPDLIIESGNGRVGAIQQAYEQFPDRAAEYRQQIEMYGFEIPAGIEQPVLIARRTSDLDDAARRDFVVAAQDSGVARMTPTEVAQTSARAMTADRLATFDPSMAFDDPGNGGFVRSVLQALPRSERNALFDASGALNAEGRRRLSGAFFARAWDAPDMIQRFAELEDAGELKSLMTAMDRSAPDWATLRAEVEAGQVKEAFDVSGYVIDAMRLIAQAREGAGAGKSIADLVQELLEDVDLLDGGYSPLTVRLVKTFYPKGRAASADKVTEFLTAYAREARSVGKSGDMLGGTPAEVLARLDDRFADLPDDLGRPRGMADPIEIEPIPEDLEMPGVEDLDTRALREEIEANDLGAEFLDTRFKIAEGVEVSPREILDGLDQDRALVDAVNHCYIGGAA